MPHCRAAGYGVGGAKSGGALRWSQRKRIFHLSFVLVLTIDGKQGYPAAQLAPTATYSRSAQLAGRLAEQPGPGGKRNIFGHDRKRMCESTDACFGHHQRHIAQQGAAQIMEIYVLSLCTRRITPFSPLIVIHSTSDHINLHIPCTYVLIVIFPSNILFI